MGADASLLLLHGRLEDGNNGILVVGHHKDAAELVKQRLELRAPHVLVVHNLFQVVMSPEIVKQPGISRQKRAEKQVEAQVSVTVVELMTLVTVGGKYRRHELSTLQRSRKLNFPMFCESFNITFNHEYVIFLSLNDVTASRLTSLTYCSC